MAVKRVRKEELLNPIPLGSRHSWGEHFSDSEIEEIAKINGVTKVSLSQEGDFLILWGEK
jgi:hypothetical protein